LDILSSVIVFVPSKGKQNRVNERFRR